MATYLRNEIITLSSEQTVSLPIDSQLLRVKCDSDDILEVTYTTEGTPIKEDFKIILTPVDHHMVHRKTERIKLLNFFADSEGNEYAAFEVCD